MSLQAFFDKCCESYANKQYSVVNCKGAVDLFKRKINEKEEAYNYIMYIFCKTHNLNHYNNFNSRVLIPDINIEMPNITLEELFDFVSPETKITCNGSIT